MSSFANAPGSSASLVVVNRNGETTNVACRSLVTIGRVPPNDVVFQSDPKVSRNHALIRIMGDGQYYLTDLGSSNGTYVNGSRVMVPYPLNDGDRIKIGDSTICFTGAASRPASNGAFGDGDGATILTVGAAVQQLTILVADIRNFTAMNERLPHDVLAVVLGRFFRDCTEAVERNGGVVDKFIGDAIMARWLVGPGGVESSVLLSLSAVHGMWTVVQKLNAEFAALGNALRIGAGINTGQAVLGNVGAGGSRDYTALGDSVNIAFRLESASKELMKDVVIGPSSYQALPPTWWQQSLQPVLVKNKAEPIPVWAVTFEQLPSMIQRA
jgi:adenylate cyclase